VFGKPQVGTKLMQDKQAIALDLPLRLSVWEDARKRVWVNYPSVGDLAGQYGIKDKAVVSAMERLLDGLAARSTDVY